MKKIVDRSFIVEWNSPKVYLGDIQDYFGIDEFGNLCSMKIQLLHNVDSEILEKEPEILTNIPKKIECSEIKKSDLINSNKSIDNCRQFLFKDNLIFLYNISNRLTDLSLTYKMITENVFLLFDEKVELQYVILKKIKDFNVVGKKISSEKIIQLFFKIYTYNQDDNLELINLIKEIEVYLEKEGTPEDEVFKLLEEELGLLKEELEY